MPDRLHGHALFDLTKSTFGPEEREKEIAAHPEYATMLPSEVDGKIDAALRAFAANQPAAHQAMKAHDLEVVMMPYAAIAGVVLNDIGPVIEADGIARIKTYVGRAGQPADFAQGAAALRRLFADQFPDWSDEDWRDMASRTSRSFLMAWPRSRCRRWIPNPWDCRFA